MDAEALAQQRSRPVRAHEVPIGSRPRPRRAPTAPGIPTSPTRRAGRAPRPRPAPPPSPGRPARRRCPPAPTPSARRAAPCSRRHEPAAISPAISEADERVDRVPAGREHDAPATHHAERAERVAGGVPQHALEVDVLALARCQHPGREPRCRPGRRRRAPARRRRRPPGGSDRRAIAPTTISTAIATQRDAVDERPQDLAALDSRRCASGVGAMPARRAATSPIAIAPTSESRWPASASSASESVRMPPTTVAASSATLIASAHHMRVRFSARRASSACECW